MKTVSAVINLLLALALLTPAKAQENRLTAPSNGHIEVAFLVSDGAVMIDFAGPWEVFSDVMLHTQMKAHQDLHPFHLYTVAETRKEIRISGGMRVNPDYTFEDAPKPNIVVIPAQSDESPAVMAWIRKMSKESNVLMSVCTGAFLLAKAGVLDGKSATTHHDAYATLLHAYPKISVQKGMRYVRSDQVIFTSGGLSSGIDLALHIVELYYGREMAEETANHLEYEGTGWAGTGTARSDFSTHGMHAVLDNPSNHTFGNVSTNFNLSGKAVQFSFGGDPAYQGTLSGDGTTINGTLFMSDGSSSTVTWTKSGTVITASTATPAIVGEWHATVPTSHGQQNLVLHIQE